MGVDARKIAFELPQHVHFLQADVFELLPEDLHQFSRVYDVVLSDLAPSTTGLRSVDSDRSSLLFERALFLADGILVPGGHVLGKVFQGSRSDVIVGELKAKFRTVRILRPRAVRKKSKEIYLVAMGKRRQNSAPPDRA